MRKNKLLSILAIALMTIFSGCEEYLDIPPEATLSERDVFGSYDTFEGYIDEILELTVDYNRHGFGRTMSLGGEAVSPINHSVFQANRGYYTQGTNGLMGNWSVFFPHSSGGRTQQPKGGLYSHMWICLRIANNALEKLESGILTNATDEQRLWLRGQALFYRAFWHYEFVRIWGSIPYIDLVIPEDQQMQFMKRYWSYESGGRTYNDTQAVLQRVVEDMEAAAQLLPAVWPNANINWGRPSKLAAFGYMTKALQFAASPLFNEQATGNPNYDNDLLLRTAQAAQATIDLAKSLVGQQPDGMPSVDANGLTKWEDIRQMFCTFSGEIQPGTMEVLFKKPTGAYGQINIQTAGSVYGERSLSNRDAAQGSQQYVDKFEMSDGTRYRQEYDNIKEKRWENRDPRFRLNFYVHGDQIGNITLNYSSTARSIQIACYVIRKYFPDGFRQGNVGRMAYATPLLRLADIYLTYAEAAYELSGSYTSIPSGCSLTAEQAVNIVRVRAGQPDVASTLPNYQNNILPHSEEIESDSPFRLLYRNERAVELSYEGVYWHDIRRWKRAHLKDGSPLQILAFDLVGNQNQGTNPIDNETVVRVSAADNGNYTFKESHYWMPFRNDMVIYTLDWPQNPGW